MGVEVKRLYFLVDELDFFSLFDFFIYCGFFVLFVVRLFILFVLEFEFFSDLFFLLVFLVMGYLEWKREKIVVVGELVGCLFLILGKGDEVFEIVWLIWLFWFLLECLIFVVIVFFD